MRPIIVTEFVSLDGVVEAPGGGDLPRAGWTFKEVEFDPAAYEIKGREQQEATAMLLGRVSYEEFAPVWPGMDDFAGYNAMPKYVVSTTLDEAPWGEGQATILRSTDAVRDLRDGEGGPIIVHGSARLVQSLIADGLVDRFHLLVFPIVLGTGSRLFPTTALGADAGGLTLTEHEAYGNGVVKLVYDVRR